MGLLILIFIKSNLCFISWLHSSYVLNCEKKKSDELLKSNLQPIEKKKCTVRLFCVWCRIMTIYQLFLYLTLVQL